MNPKPIIAIKQVKHTFTDRERLDLCTDMLNARSNRIQTETEFESVKADYKAKVTAAEACEGSIAASLNCGFELRAKECRVVFAPKDRRKFFYLATTTEDIDPVADEPMTPDDFQAELLQAESDFEHREEIAIFPPTGADSGVIVVGRIKSLWYEAIRVRVGKHSLDERLNPEAAGCKQRFDAILKAKKRLEEWMKSNLKDHAKGFQDSITAACEAHKERAE